MEKEQGRSAIFRCTAEVWSSCCAICGIHVWWDETMFWDRFSKKLAIQYPLLWSSVPPTFICCAKKASDIHCWARVSLLQASQCRSSVLLSNAGKVSRVPVTWCKMGWMDGDRIAQSSWGEMRGDSPCVSIAVQSVSNRKPHCFATTNPLFWEKKQHWEIWRMQFRVY